MSLMEFLRQVAQNPVLMVSSVLTLGVILVNGWTDAPNAIATCVSTRAIGLRKAIIMAAICNFFGVLVMTAVNASVAMTIYSMVDFGGNAHEALIALCAAMTAIVIWATAAWYFGIPTSESHALIAGLTGAAVAIHGNFSGVNWGEWQKVLWGLLLSTVLGFGLGFGMSKLVTFLFRGRNRTRCDSFFAKSQVAGGAAMAFMHGAQDGQKFMAVFLLGAALANRADGSVGFFRPAVADDSLLGCHGGWDFHRGLPHYQVGRNGYGQTQALPGFFGGRGGRGLPADILALGHPREYHAYQDHGNYGGGCFQAPAERQLERGAGSGADLGLYLPGVRHSGFSCCKAVSANFCVKWGVGYGTKPKRLFQTD